MEGLRRLKSKELLKIVEVQDRSNFLKKTIERSLMKVNYEDFSSSGLTANQFKSVLDGGILTYLLHCEARVASYLGQGFYTIGPCGEELLGAISLNLKSTDLTAMHYRHLCNSIVRQLEMGKSIESIALDRARGFTCSTLDPVTGGRHCSIGGSKQEFIVTSTLASQAPAAVGRALAIPLSQLLIGGREGDSGPSFAKDAVSLTSMGDGSTHNAHFLSALHLARYAEHSSIKCPVVFVVSDNELSISLKGNGFVEKFFTELQRDGGKTGLFGRSADGQDIFSIFNESRKVIEYSRSTKRPSFLYVRNIPRRFGHAATDRQFAYMTEQEIRAQQEKDPLSRACAIALNLGILTEKELTDKFTNIQAVIEDSFNVASVETKISSREALILSNSRTLPTLTIPSVEASRDDGGELEGSGREVKEPMRKLMTRCFEEILEKNKDVVYIGEDVEHGGYYLVTEGLKKRFPLQVLNFPPDETTLVGAGVGFSQAGLLPIVEIPYAKYLDCAADVYHEAIIANWLSNGQQPNGMVVRLQGFDSGIFGGNFHTHNMIQIPPGLDVVCYSNGLDYVKGMRYCLRAAKEGRVVLSVDSTALLNRRHLIDTEKDETLLRKYPSNEELELSFDEIIVYKSEYSRDTRVVIVTYGNGVPCALLARRLLEVNVNIEVTIVDCPYLSSPPKQLEGFLRDKEKKSDVVLFADVCKEGSGMPLGAGIALDLQKKGILNGLRWGSVGAARTYNPLGNTISFLNERDIIESVNRMLSKKEK